MSTKSTMYICYTITYKCVCVCARTGVLAGEMYFDWAVPQGRCVLCIWGSRRIAPFGLTRCVSKTQKPKP